MLMRAWVSSLRRKLRVGAPESSQLCVTERPSFLGWSDMANRYRGGIADRRANGM